MIDFMQADIHMVTGISFFLVHILYGQACAWVKGKVLLNILHGAEKYLAFFFLPSCFVNVIRSILMIYPLEVATQS